MILVVRLAQTKKIMQLKERESMPVCESGDYASISDNDIAPEHDEPRISCTADDTHDGYIHTNIPRADSTRLLLS